MHPLHFPAILKENISKGCKEKAMTDCKLRAKNCGGCPLLGLDYAAQLKQKEEKVRTLVGKYGPVRPIRGMQQPWHYPIRPLLPLPRPPAGK